MFHKMNLLTFVTLLGLLACSVIRTDEAIVPPPCPMENLMLDQSLFPEGWHQQGPPRQRLAPVRWGIEKLGVTFITQENGVAVQAVHRGENFSHTEDGYFELVDSWFDSEEDATDWYIPPEFNYESAIANHDRFGCRTYKPSGVESCQLVGQYGVYLTRFHTFMSPIMTYDDLAHILQAIDDKMAQCLNE